MNDNRNNLATWILIGFLAFLVFGVITLSWAIDTKEIRMPKDGYTVQDMLADDGKADVIVGISTDGTLAGQSNSHLVTEKAVYDSLDNKVFQDVKALNTIMQMGTGANFQINPYSMIQMGRLTNSAAFSVDVMKGDGSTTINHRLKGDGDSYIAANNGNVGIGKTNPAYRLDVNGTGHFSSVRSDGSIVAAGQMVANSLRSLGNVYTGVDFFANGGIGANYMAIDTSTLTVDPVNHRVGIRAATSPTVTLDVGGDISSTGMLRSQGLIVDTNTLAVDAVNNRVGIGKTNPAVALDVVGAITASGNLTAANVYDKTAVDSAISSAVGGRIPYTGATGALNMNSKNLTGVANFEASSAAVSGNVTVGGTLGVTGNLTALNMYDKTAVDDRDTLRVPYTGATGSVNLNTKSLTGVDVLNSSSLGVSGNATVGGTLGVTGDLTAPNVYTKTQVDASVGLRVPYSGASGNVALGANDLSGRNASFTGTLGATGAATLGGALSVAGNATVTGRLISDSIKQVSGQGLVLGMNLNSASISGTTSLDSSTYANHGTISGAIPEATGGFNGGGYLSFDGVDDYVTIPDNDILDMGVNHTISVWIYNSSYPSELFVIASKNVGGVYGWAIIQLPTYLSFQSYNPSTGNKQCRVLNADIPLNQWNLITATIDSTNFNMYANGKWIYSLAHSNSFPAITTAPVYLGKWMDQKYFAGKLDDFRIYNRALSAAEIKALYDSRQEVAMPKLSLYSPSVQHVYSDLTLHGVWSDLTPGWSKTPDEALSAIVATGSKMGKAESKAEKGKAPKMEIDHATLPIEAQVVLGMDEATSEPVVGRNLGMMLTIQGEAIKALEARLKKLEGGRAN